MNRCLSRRHFLRRSALAGAGVLVLSRPESARAYAANEQINVALVGVGGRGEWFVDYVPRLENVVAVCDVNDQKITTAFERWAAGAQRLAASKQDWERKAAPAFERLAARKPKIFRDFRKMLDELGPALDAVVVATPDHTHAVVSAAAMKAGKAVFCEKPLTRTLHESRALRELARRHRVPTAMGNQGTYSGAFRRALELIRRGDLGEIKEVHVWNDGGGADRKAPPSSSMPVPAYLDWDLWLGPAAARPFHAEWLQRHLWREFGTCQLGNWGSHTANLGFMALKVHELWLSSKTSSQLSTLNSQLVTVSAKTSGMNKLSFPRWEQIQWEIPARAEFPPIVIQWYNGVTPAMKDILARASRDLPDKEKDRLRFAGTFMVGTKGSIVTTGHNMSFCLVPEEAFKGVQCDHPEIVESSRGPEQDFFGAIRGGKSPWSNFDYADALNEFLMLGNVATQFESKLEFDPVSMKIVNNREADALLRSEYRQGWTL